MDWVQLLSRYETKKQSIESALSQINVCGLSCDYRVDESSTKNWRIASVFEW